MRSFRVADNELQLHAVEKLRWLKRWIFQLLVGAVIGCPSFGININNLK
jgi:hypothetical protein